MRRQSHLSKRSMSLGLELRFQPVRVVEAQTRQVDTPVLERHAAVEAALCGAVREGGGEGAMEVDGGAGGGASLGLLGRAGDLSCLMRLLRGPAAELSTHVLGVLLRSLLLPPASSCALPALHGSDGAEFSGTSHCE